MKKLFNLLLGVVTSIGGFVEVGSISTAAQAGAQFGFALLWAVAIAGLLLASLTEMAGRVATVSKRSISAAVRERFGFHFQLVPLGAELAIDLLLLTAELGGAAIAVRLLTGTAFLWWIVPVGLFVFAVLWFGSFATIEDGVGLLGVVTLSFIVATWRGHPDARAVAAGFIPRLPGHDLTRYAFLAVSIVGATVSPYLLNFYASGAVEEHWTEDMLWMNRVTAFAGMGFGSIVSMGVLATAAIVLAPLHIRVESYEQAALMFLPAFGRWGVTLFALSLGIGCLGAATELTLNAGYLVAQSFGWTWGVERERREAARFSAAFTAVLLAAVIVALLGFDPLRMTLISVALTVVIMPIIVLPFLVLMNEERYVGRHVNSAAGNAVLAVLVLAGAMMAVVVVPLEVLGG
ncbi:MAG TPA: divalent metal cation transporter [Vicinamibacterales bacterium]|nr:divalent metal cation transporter [Vicinamibacterales bacterium]